MKKNTLLLAMLTAVPALGQQVIIKDTVSYLNVIPHQFTVNDKPILHILDSDDDNKYLTLYNDEIEKIADITIPNNHTFDYTITYQDETRDVKGATKEIISQSIQCVLNENYTFEDFIRETSYYYPSMEFRIDEGDSIAFYSEYINDFFQYHIFDTKYPIVYYLCKNNIIYHIQCNYTPIYTDWIPTGEEYKKEYSYELPIIPLDYANFDVGNFSYHPYQRKFILTQTLFNNDDKFEYIIPKIELTDNENHISIYPDTEISGPIIISPSWGSRSQSSVTINRSKANAYPTITGFQVVSSDGNILHDINFTNGFWIDEYECSEISIITLGEKDYLVAEGYIENEDREDISSMMFYRINRQTNSLQEVQSLPVKMRMKQQESTINVHLSNTTEPSEIIMTNSLGKIIGKKHVPAGENMATFKTSMPKGVYNITRIQNGKNIENGKILLK